MKSKLSERDEHEEDAHRREVQAEEGARAFSRFFELLCEGDAHAHASEELNKLGIVLQKESLARDAEVKGSMSITIKFTASPRGVVATNYELKTKHPAPKTTAGTLFLTPGGNFSTESHRQPMLPGMRVVKDVHEAPRAAKVVGE